VYNILDCALADYNVQWKDEGSPLQAASLGGYEKIVELLLAKGASVDAKEGRSGSPLEAASLKDYEKIVDLLLAKSANVDAGGGRYGSPLQAVSFRGHENIVKMLQLCSQELPYRWMQGN
jgi:ankyrin repeat protein